MAQFFDRTGLWLDVGAFSFLAPKTKDKLIKGSTAHELYVLKTIGENVPAIGKLVIYFFHTIIKIDFSFQYTRTLS